MVSMRLKALFKILKSVILSPLCFFSPIIVDFLILKIVELISLISCSGITSTDVHVL